MKRLFFVIVICLLSLTVLGLQWSGCGPDANREAELMDIKDFVRQTFIHGVPYEEVGKYDSTVLPTLLEMLDDPAEKAHLSNIVVTLGMLGDERAVGPMIECIEKAPEGTPSRSHYNARMSAVMSLGYLINKSGSEKALAYLKGCLRPEAWVERKVTWDSPYHASVEDRNLQLTRMAVLGLALSGRPEAGEALRSLQKPAATEPAKRFQAQVSDVVSEALSAHETISKDGLASYYRKMKR